MSAVGDARKRRQEEGRRLASERDDLIAQGVDPAELLIPLGPDDLTARREARVPQPDGPASITFGMDDEQIVFRYQAALDEYVRGAQLAEGDRLTAARAAGPVRRSRVMSAVCPECRAGKHVNCDGGAWDFENDEATGCTCDHSCAPDCCHALGPCTCARDGNASRCVHHTQEDFDAADRARGLPDPGRRP